MALQGAMAGETMHSAISCRNARLDVPRCKTLHRHSGVASTHCSAQTLSRTYTGMRTAPPKGGHHFLHIDDFSKDELSAMLSTARRVKDRVLRSDNAYKPLAGKTMAMIFTKPSMRTRVSFETVSSAQVDCVSKNGWHSAVETSSRDTLDMTFMSGVL